MKTDREKLIDFFLYLESNGLIVERIECSKVIINYEESINKALDETKTVNNNECQEKLCDAPNIKEACSQWKKEKTCIGCLFALK
jgi:hypothetical protein